MVDIFNEDISNFIYHNKHKIPVIASIHVTDFLWGRLDLVVKKYWGSFIKDEDIFPWYQILLDFNEVSNPIEVKLGSVIDVPDINWIFQTLNINSGDVCGVAKLVPTNEYQTPVVNGSKTIAIPKLRVTQNKVKYNNETGEVVF